MEALCLQRNFKDSQGQNVTGQREVFFHSNTIKAGRKQNQIGLGFLICK